MVNGYGSETGDTHLTSLHAVEVGKDGQVRYSLQAYLLDERVSTLGLQPNQDVLLRHGQQLSCLCIGVFKY